MGIQNLQMAMQTDELEEAFRLQDCGNCLDRPIAGSPPRMGTQGMREQGQGEIAMRPKGERRAKKDHRLDRGAPAAGVVIRGSKGGSTSRHRPRYLN